MLTGGVTLTAVSIASAANQSRVDQYRSAETTYNSAAANLNKENAATPGAVTQLTTSTATGKQHIAELQKLSAAESAFSPESRTTITEILPTVTAALPDEQETAKLAAASTELTASPVAQLKQAPKLPDDEITEDKTSKLGDETKKLESLLAATKLRLENWAKTDEGIAPAITATLPALVAAAQSAHAAAGTLIEATSAATPESHQAILNALVAIDATPVVVGTVAASDATVEDVRALSAALNVYVDTITARGESHVAGVNAAAEAAAAEAAAQQNQQTYTSPDGSQKPNPRYSPPSSSGSGNPSGGTPNTPGGGGNPSGGGGQAPWSPGGNYVPGCAGFSDSDFSKTMANRAGEASPGFPYDYSVSGDVVTIYRCI